MNSRYFLYTFFVLFSLTEKNAIGMKRSNQEENKEFISQRKILKTEIKLVKKHFNKISKPFAEDPVMAVDGGGIRYLKFEALKKIEGQKKYAALVEADRKITRLYMQMDDLEIEFNEVASH